MWPALVSLVLGLLKWLFERSETDYELVEGTTHEDSGDFDIADYPDL